MAFWQPKQRNLGNKDDAPRAGFDNPLSDPHYDLLERKSVTNHVYAYLTEIDPKWSVRVGLIAPWGEGKTTIGEWIAERALKEGHIPVWWRDPWTANTDAELWLGFYTALTASLKNQGIEFESSVKHTIASISGSNLAKKASELHNYAQAGLGFVQDLTRITSEDIDKLKTALGEKRVIVIIDELDRVDAALIPRLLMSLRGVMDLEGFSFLIPWLFAKFEADI
jgi:predicted KAP-like P-loop ATPase